MRLPTLLLFLIFYQNPISEAQVMIGEKSRIKNESGKVLEFDEWQKLMQTNDYGLKESPGEKETFILFKLSAEEKERMLAFMKNAGPGGNSPMASPYFKTGEQIAPFTATDMNGLSADLTGMRGKVVVLNFWFVGCAPCRQEIPELNNLVEKFSTGGQVEFIAIALDKKAAIQKMLTKLPFRYRHIPEGERIAKDQFGVAMYPTHVVIDQEGKVVFHTSGLSPATIPAIETSIAGLISPKR